MKERNSEGEGESIRRKSRENARPRGIRRNRYKEKTKESPTWIYYIRKKMVFTKTRDRCLCVKCNI